MICRFEKDYQETEAIAKFQKKYQETTYCTICKCWELSIGDIIFKIDPISSIDLLCYFVVNSSLIKANKHGEKHSKKLSECFEWWREKSGAIIVEE